MLKEFAPSAIEDIDRVILKPFRVAIDDKNAFAQNLNLIETEANRYIGKQIVEEYNNGFVYINSPYEPISEEEMDDIYNLPYTKLPHPKYKGKHIPAYEMIKNSITTHIGCFRGCTFCTFPHHRGKPIQSRSAQ